MSQITKGWKPKQDSTTEDSQPWGASDGDSKSKQSSEEEKGPKSESNTEMANATAVDGNKAVDGDKAAECTPVKPKERKGSISTAKHIYRGKEDSKGNATWSDKIPENASETPAEDDETAQYAVLVRNKISYDSRKSLEIQSLVIQSPWLKTALNEIFKDYPGVCCKVDRLVFNTPFEPFVHRWGDFIKFMKKPNNSKTKEHLELLHLILKEELKDTIKAFEDFLVHGVITYEHVWTIFQPGTIVVFPYFDVTTAGEFKRGSYVETQWGMAYRLSCDIIDWGGQFFGRRSEYVQIPEFVGTAGIESLSAFPLTFSPQIDVRLKADLIKRGKKFESLAGFQYRRYSTLLSELILNSCLTSLVDTKAMR